MLFTRLHATASFHVIILLIALKLDQETMFEWQKHSQSSCISVLTNQKILKFCNLHTQASELADKGRPEPRGHDPKVAS